MTAFALFPITRGVIEVNVLAGDRYERRERSVLLPELDLIELARHIDPEH